MPRIIPIVRFLNIIPILPDVLLKPPFFIMKYLFGTRNSKLLKKIIDDTDSDFLRWAIDKIVNWENTEDIDNLYSIHGTNDRLIPMTNKPSFTIEDGGHFMIVDNASHISKLVNDITIVNSKP